MHPRGRPWSRGDRGPVEEDFSSWGDLSVDTCRWYLHVHIYTSVFELCLPAWRIFGGLSLFTD